MQETLTFRRPRKRDEFRVKKEVIKNLWMAKDGFIWNKKERPCNECCCKNDGSVSELDDDCGRSQNIVKEKFAILWNENIKLGFK